MIFSTPPYEFYRCPSAPNNVDYDALPKSYRHMPLHMFLDIISVVSNKFRNATVLFDVGGFSREDVCLYLYVRPSRYFPKHFTIVRIELGGTVIEDINEENDLKEKRGEVLFPNSGVMYGKGALRALLHYLNIALPRNGFDGIFIESVGNEILRSVLLRYGFVTAIDPDNGRTTEHLVKHFQNR